METTIKHSTGFYLPEITNWSKGIAWSKVGERFWCGLSLILFMILGPFAAPIALFAALSCGNQENCPATPEPINEAN